MTTWAANPRNYPLPERDEPDPRMTWAQTARAEMARYHGESPAELKNGRPSHLRDAVFEELAKRRELTTGDLVARLETYHQIKLPGMSLVNSLSRWRREGRLVSNKLGDILIWRLP